MKKNVIAVMLSIVMAMGSIGGAPVLAAETTVIENEAAEAAGSDAAAETIGADAGEAAESIETEAAEAPEADETKTAGTDEAEEPADTK